MKQRKPTDFTWAVARAWIAACFSAVVARRGRTAASDAAAAPPVVEGAREEEEAWCCFCFCCRKRLGVEVEVREKRERRSKEPGRSLDEKGKELFLLSFQLQAATHHAESRRVRHALAVDREGCVGGLRGLLARGGEDAEGAARRHFFRWNSIQRAKVRFFFFFALSLFIFRLYLSSAATKRERERKKSERKNNFLSA